ncbi:MAG: hypothetical protein ACT4QE_09985 [Anaerolineales bacterium]
MPSTRFSAAALALALTILACQTLNSEPTPSLPPGVLLVDDFSDPSSGWATGADTDGSLDYERGQYAFRVQTGSYFTWGNLSRREFDNVRIEVEVDNQSASTEPTFGVICHYQDSANFYYAGFGSDGYYAIVRSEDGADTFLSAERAEWAPSDAITTNADAYTLAVECANGTITLQVDGAVIASAEDATFASGQIGLFVLTFDQPEAHVRFDNLQISEVK